MAGILSLPDEILDKIMSFVSYDEVSHLRLVCKTFDAAAQRVLNQGYRKVEKYYAQCLRKVKEQLPRRESERRKHHLAVHSDILTSVETRLSLLGMTFMKYVEYKYCCFIPGKVLDELFKILRIVSTMTAVPSAHDLLQELRDISSMAMEHFEEKIAPAFISCKVVPKICVTPYGALPSYNAANSDRPHHTSGSSSSRTGENTEVFWLNMSLHYNKRKIIELKKENNEIKRELLECRRKITENDIQLEQQKNLIVQQGAVIAENYQKLTDISRMLAEAEHFLLDFELQCQQLPGFGLTSYASRAEVAKSAQNKNHSSKPSPPKKRKLMVEGKRKRHKK